MGGGWPEEIFFCPVDVDLKCPVFLPALSSRPLIPAFGGKFDVTVYDIVTAPPKTRAPGLFGRAKRPAVGVSRGPCCVQSGLPQGLPVAVSNLPWQSFKQTWVQRERK